MSNESFAFCSDFGHSTDSPAGTLTSKAWAKADATSMPEDDKRAFTQGFIHAAQGRPASPEACQPYNAGFAAYRAA